MVQRTHIVLEDDIDGSAADSQVSFAFEGVTYEIDLNPTHAAEFREAVAPWISHARRVGGRRSARRGTTTTIEAAGPSATEIREWAKKRGIEVSSRGRVPATVRAAYEEAHA